jgi:hypothetical protein
LKPEITGDDIARKDLDASVKLHHRIIIGLARESDLVLGRGQFFLQA